MKQFWGRAADYSRLGRKVDSSTLTRIFKKRRADKIFRMNVLEVLLL